LLGLRLAADEPPRELEDPGTEFAEEILECRLIAGLETEHQRNIRVGGRGGGNAPRLGDGLARGRRLGRGGVPGTPLACAVRGQRWRNWRRTGGRCPARWGGRHARPTPDMPAGCGPGATGLGWAKLLSASREPRRPRSVAGPSSGADRGLR